LKEEITKRRRKKEGFLILFLFLSLKLGLYVEEGKGLVKIKTLLCPLLFAQPLSTISTKI